MIRKNLKRISASRVTFNRRFTIYHKINIRAPLQTPRQTRHSKGICTIIGGGIDAR